MKRLQMCIWSRQDNVDGSEARKHAPRHEKMYLRARAPSEDSDQTALSHSLIRIFTGHIMDVQTDLSIRWAHISNGTFSDGAAHICLNLNIRQITTDRLLYFPNVPRQLWKSILMYLDPS